MFIYHQYSHFSWKLNPTKSAGENTCCIGRIAPCVMENALNTVHYSLYTVLYFTHVKQYSDIYILDVCVYVCMYGGHVSIFW